MKLTDFDYNLPKELIAQYPIEERDRCRLMVLDRISKSIFHKIFKDIVDYFKEGDCLVLNDTKVIPARLFGKRESGGKVEIFLLEKRNPTCEALVKPSSRLKAGETIELESGDRVKILNRGVLGRFVKFNRSLDDILDDTGHIPLPPYIDRRDEASDRFNYQTIYARREGATASPTAGLHFTKELLDEVEAKGVKVVYLTLHTNYGTFAPIKTEDVESHKMHKEYFELPGETADVVRKAKKGEGRIFAAGTTATRVLEECAEYIMSDTRDARRDLSGYTNLYIYPTYEFKIVDRIITNFHLPRSTLLLLTCAFADKDFIFEAYRHATEKRYRFYSYGDAMLII